MIELADAKGLEFDTVIIPDATAQNYPVNLLARHRLYTAVSRATERLIVLSDGPMTKLLPAGAVSQSAEKMESSNGEKK
jgi:DNA helicase-2/ATP-dependent DNA helicase PcrA